MTEHQIVPSENTKVKIASSKLVFASKTKKEYISRWFGGEIYSQRAKFNLGRQGETNIISESGFYTLVLKAVNRLKNHLEFVFSNVKSIHIRNNYLSEGER